MLMQYNIVQKTFSLKKSLLLLLGQIFKQKEASGDIRGLFLYENVVWWFPRPYG
jgi:hypothetical protein